MENKQTAVEWLDRWFRDNPEATHEEGNKALEQAKEIERGQMIDAYKKYQSYLIEEFLIQERTYKDSTMHKPFEGNSKTFEQWIETYGSNENFKQFSLYEHKETIATADTPTSSQTEISDEEIIQKAIKETDTFRAIWSGKGCYSKGYIEGAQWYREQLKQRQ